MVVWFTDRLVHGGEPGSFRLGGQKKEEQAITPSSSNLCDAAPGLWLWLSGWVSQVLEPLGRSRESYAAFQGADARCRTALIVHNEIDFKLILLRLSGRRSGEAG